MECYINLEKLKPLVLEVVEIEIKELLLKSQDRYKSFAISYEKEDKNIYKDIAK